MLASETEITGEPPRAVATESTNPSKPRRRRRNYARKLHSTLRPDREPRDHPMGRQDIVIVRPEFAPDRIPEGVDFDFEPGELIDEHALHYLSSPVDYRHADRVENPGHTRLIAFQTESQERAEIEHKRKLLERKKKLQRRAERAQIVTVETKAQMERRQKSERDGESFFRRHCLEMEEVKDRYENGFYFPGGTVAGALYGPFKEDLGKNVLRSRLGSPNLARAAQIIPRVKSGLRVGSDKEVVLPAKRKLFGTDAPYVELDSRFARVVAIDSDGVWDNEAACLEDLRTIIPDPRMMPSVVPGRHNYDGNEFRHPHFIWYLSQFDEDGNERDSSVWLDVERETADGKIVGDKRCRQRPIKFLRQVIRGLKMLLLPLGADVGFHNTHKPKNALSPFFTTIVVNEEHWPTLKDFFSIPGFRIDVTDDELKEAATKIRLEATGATPEISNRLWTVVGNVIEPMAREALSKREASFVTAGSSSEQALAAWFEARVRPIVELDLKDDLAGDEKMQARLDKVLERRCTFAASYCRRRRANRGKRRGRDRDAFFAVQNAKERRQIAADRSGKQRHAVKLHEMRKTIVSALGGGGSLTKTELIRDYVVGRKSFAYKHWDEAIAGLSVEFRDGAYRYIGWGSRPRVIIPPALTTTDSVSVEVPDNREIIELVADPPPITDPGGLDDEKPCPDAVKRVLEPA